MSKKRLLSIVISAVICLSFACTAMAVEKSERYVGDSTVNGSIYQTYYQVDAQTRTEVKKISVSGVLYAINAVDGKKLVSSGGQLFFTSYFAGSSNTDGKNSGRLRQNGSNYLASTKSYTYTEILHYYYDNSSYNNPSVGIVKIN